MYSRVVFVIFLLVNLWGKEIFAQVPLVKDSTIASKTTKSDTLRKVSNSNSTNITIDSSKTTELKRKGISKPTIATLLSTAVPGAGQVYNGINWYWKVPIIYGLMGGLVAWAVDNGWKYNLWSTRYNEAFTTPVGDNYASFSEQFSTLTKDQITNQIRVIRDGYRRDRDFAIILTSVVYILNIADACVDAHLKEFDVNEKLAMKIRPSVHSDVYNPYVAGISMQIILKSPTAWKESLTF